MVRNNNAVLISVVRLPVFSTKILNYACKIKLFDIIAVNIMHKVKISLLFHLSVCYNIIYLYFIFKFTFKITIYITNYVMKV